MFEVPIDDIRYHGAILSEKEKKWAWGMFCRIAEDKDFSSYVEKELAPLYLSKKQKNGLLTDITVAFAHEIKISFVPANEKELTAWIKKRFRVFLPYLVQNLLVLHATHPVQYEPLALTSIYVSNLLGASVEDAALSQVKTDFDRYALLELSALFRAFRSLMLMLTVGDDVHAMVLLRGVLEIGAKIVLAEAFSEEFVLFKEFNFHLQNYKHNKKPLPSEMTEYLKNEKGFAKNKEAFLAYGWARKKNGARILTMTDLLREAYPQSPEILRLFNIASEFVHEDYAGIDYDYIAMRKLLVDICFALYTQVKECDLLSLLPSKAKKRATHLLALASPYYRGEL